MVPDGHANPPDPPGRRVLRRARKGLRIAVGHDYRDVVALTALGVTKGRLR